MVDHDRMARVYLKMRAKKAELKRAYEEEVAVIDAGMAQIENALLASLLANKVKSMGTASGTFYQEKVVKPSVADWGVYYQFMKDNDAMEGVEKRVSKKFVVDYMEANKDDTPPGVTVFTENVVRIRTS